MNILAIETSSSESSIALVADSKILSSNLPEQRQQIKQILPMIDGLLKQSDLSVKELDGIALSIGPGSFTGLRVGLGIAQGLSLAHDIPLAPVSSLQALAQTHYRLTGSTQVVCCRNAFMNQVYYAEYQLQGNLMIASQADALLAPNEVPLTEIATKAGDGWQLIEGYRQTSVLTAAEAIDVVQIAQAEGQWCNVEDIQINYLRDKSAWLPSKN